MRWMFVLFLLLVGPLGSRAQEASYPRIGLVLSGGGARGAAHVGVLKVLEEMRIPIAAIAGTSMGALVGGAYASGVPVKRLEKVLQAADWDDLFVDDPPRANWPMRRKDPVGQPAWDFTIGMQQDWNFSLPSGVLVGQKIELFLSDLVEGGELNTDFDRLPIPFRAVATDLEDGSLKVFSRGALPEVMRASMSVPGVFAPVEIDDHLYVDGGLVRNLPVDIARRMGVDLIIAINLGSSYLPREKIQNVLGVMEQMIAILTEQNVQRSLQQLRPGDILIEPELGDFSASDFKNAAKAIAIGEAAVREAAPRLAHLSLSPAAYAAWKASLSKSPTENLRIQQARVKGSQRVNPKIFQPLIAHQAGKPLDTEQLHRDIQRLYGRGDFQRINYRIESSGKHEGTLILDAQEKPWGPGYLSFGLGFHSDFSGDNRFGLRSTYQRTWLNRLGGEWLTSAQLGNELDFYTEFYQPLSLDPPFFVSPYFQFSDRTLSVFAGPQRIARYDIARTRFGLDVGSTLFDERAEIRLGPLFQKVSTDLDTGMPSLGNRSDQLSGFRAHFLWDTLDDRYIPREGMRLAADFFSPQSAFGADAHYNRLFLHWMGAKRLGKHTILGRLRLGSSFGEYMPYYDQFPLGGFFNLSGYSRDQFRGNRMAFGALVYYQKIADLTPPLGRGIYAGASLELGTLRDTVDFLSEGKTRFGSSLFLGADTWLGPVFFGLGFGESGDATAYFQLGNP